MSELVYNNEHILLNRAFGVKSFGEILESSMQRESKDTKKTSFAPSSLGYSGSCARYWWYAFKGSMFKYDSEPPAVANMDAGSDAGRRIANVLSRANLLVSAEVPVRSSEPPIFGYIDALIRWKGDIVVVEIKTTKQETWNRRVLTNSVPGYQMLQLLIYMYLVKNDKGLFITENKNTNELFLLPIKMNNDNKKLVEDTLEWMTRVKRHIDEDEMPTRPFIKSSVQCKGCAVKETCWQGYKRGSVNGADPAPGTVEISPLVVPK